MKTKKTICLLAAMCLMPFAQAQKSDSLSFGGMQQFNVAFGERGSDPGITVVNGLRYGHFFAGIGADYQWVNNHGISSNTALFLDGRYYMTKAKRFFVKLDGGVNLITGMYSSWGWGWGGSRTEYEKKPGYFFGGGAGFKARIGKELFYLFDISYVVRQIRYSYSYQDWRVPNAWLTDNYDNRKPMIVVSMGLEVF